MKEQRRPARLATRLMTAQALVIAVGALALIGAAVILAPGLFHYHLAQTGETDPLVLHHAEEAFATSFALALLLSSIVSLAAAGIASWFIVRRVAHPVEELADAADRLASGSFDVDVPDAGFSSEIARLTEAFEDMAARLADTETTRRQLLSDLAHELRTPLATLEAYVDGMEDEVLPAEPATFGTMREQITRLRRLSGDLREAALAAEHALGIQLQPCDLRGVVRAAASAAAPRFEQSGIRLTSSVPDATMLVEADEDRLQQVLSNLLDNALRHTRTWVDLRLERSGELARIHVQDNGEGIPRDHLENVFRRFHRVDTSRKAADGSGSGLGLTIARAIIEDHGGKLSATSDGLGRGATFQIDLPVMT